MIKDCIYLGLFPSLIQHHIKDHSRPDQIPNIQIWGISVGIEYSSFPYPGLGEEGLQLGVGGGD